MGCYLLPGAFESDFAFGPGDRFSFRYRGEIVFAGSELMQQELKQKQAVLDNAEESATCFDASSKPEEGAKERPCTAEERTQRKREAQAGLEREPSKWINLPP